MTTHLTPARRHARTALHAADLDGWFDPAPVMSPAARLAARYVLNLWRGEPTLPLRMNDSAVVTNLWHLVSPLIGKGRKQRLRRAVADGEDDFLGDLDDCDLDAGPGETEFVRLNPAQRTLFLDWMEEFAAAALARLDALEALDHAGRSLLVIGILEQVLNLPRVERTLLEYVWVRDENSALRNFMRVSKAGGLRRNRQWLAIATGLDTHEVHRALSLRGTLHRIDLVEEDRGTCDLEDYLHSSDFFRRIVAEAPATEAELRELLVEPLPAAKWTIEDFPHLARDAARLVTTLGAAAARGGAGVNGLLYGPAGAGKTEFATAVCAAAGLCGFRVRSADEDGDGLGRRGRISAYLLAQRLLGARRDALVVFDEVEDVFSNEGLGALGLLLGGERPTGREKGFINRTLEDNPVPSLWLTNDAHSMDPAFLRRFLLPVAVHVPPRAVRRRIVDAQLGGFGLPDEFLDTLAADNKLMPAQFDAARRVLELVADPDHAATRVSDVIGAQRRLLHGSAMPHRRTGPLTVDIAFLNVAGGVAPAQLLAALDRRPRGSLCLYGPSGTGKTEFAHLIANALDLELVTQRASDLKSKYVGETERNIAEAFSSIDPERCVLLFDEVDSFLRNRRHAERSWEVCEVNELLQQMEDFPGIFIATTNLMTEIDPAALRRFDFKLAFRPLRLEQRFALFAREVFGDAHAPLAEELRTRVARLDGLTAGDFANVVRQQSLLGETLPPQAFATQLAQELRHRTHADAVH
ncbi:ATPase, AAA family protein [Azoarcus sp. CIB]|uniref:AAA family ATPase n=1 Tax=Aromatoleum sp. (strain CIB) TaxID=198107 RepID=UPI00067A7544|nr:AAA family ATPase [Azoarcus sp. CIB]AKU11282.1 ATPase, AAA family protein [Azoarcus sp. CIB]